MRYGLAPVVLKIHSWCCCAIYIHKCCTSVKFIIISYCSTIITLFFTYIVIFCAFHVWVRWSGLSRRINILLYRRLVLFSMNIYYVTPPHQCSVKYHSAGWRRGLCDQRSSARVALLFVFCVAASCSAAWLEADNSVIFALVEKLRCFKLSSFYECLSVWLSMCCTNEYQV